MRLRNKKTGAIGKYNIALQRCEGDKNAPVYYACGSLAKLNKDWEDYKLTEPLIKDEKIRKAVRAWAEANKFSSKMFFTYYANLYQLSCWQASIGFNRRIEGLEDDKEYYITELCGEEEECES